MLTVITGPPCSGKSTYAREHAQPGDIIIDYDLMCQALGSPEPHNHPDPVRHVAIAMRLSAIRAAIREHRRGATVWIVETSLRQRGQWYQEAGASVVTLSADLDELHRRADAERPAKWHALIDGWAPTDLEQAPNGGSRHW